MNKLNDLLLDCEFHHGFDYNRHGPILKVNAHFERLENEILIGYKILHFINIFQSYAGRVKE